MLRGNECAKRNVITRKLSPNLINGEFIWIRGDGVFINLGKHTKQVIYCASISPAYGINTFDANIASSARVLSLHALSMQNITSNHQIQPISPICGNFHANSSTKRFFFASRAVGFHVKRLFFKCTRCNLFDVPALAAIELSCSNLSNTTSTQMRQSFLSF